MNRLTLNTKYTVEQFELIYIYIYMVWVSWVVVDWQFFNPLPNPILYFGGLTRYFSRWFLGVVFVPTDYRHQTHSKITSTKPIYPQIDTKLSYGLSRICCFSSPFPPSMVLCQSQTHWWHCCVIVFFNNVFSDKCLWSFCSIFSFFFPSPISFLFFISDWTVSQDDGAWVGMVFSWWF